MKGTNAGWGEDGVGCMESGGVSCDCGEDEVWGE